MPTLTDMYSDAPIYDPMQQTAGLAASQPQVDTQSKTTNLLDKTQQKIELLSDKKSNILAVTDDKNQYNYAQRPDMVNNKTPDELQYELGVAADHQVLTRPDGSKYTFARNADDTYKHDANGQWIEENYNRKNSYGSVDTRNAYIDDTAEGNMKFGLARSGLSQDAIDKGITPFEARYMDKTHYNPYAGKGQYKEDGKIVYNPDGTVKVGYNGTPGAKGVTPANGSLMDIELPYNLATQLEYDIHTNAGQLANRAMGQGPKNDVTERDFGAGQTEYTTPNAPLWNSNYDMSKAKIDPTTVLPHEVKLMTNGNAVVDNTSQEAVKHAYMDTAKNMFTSDKGRNWADAVKDTGLQLVVGSENTVKNLADIYGVATGDMNNYVSTWMDQASKWTSDKYSPALKAAAQDKASKVAEGKTELDKFVIATKENVKNPMLVAQLVTESAPMMVAALAAGEGMAAASGISALEGMLSAAAIQQGVDMGREVYNSFLHVGPGQKVFQKDWDNNPKYQKLIANGATSEEAKHEIALTTARGVSLASGLLSYGVNRFMPGGHAIEEKLVGLGSKGTGIAKALVGESAIEGIEEGGGKAFQNIGLQEVNPNIKTEQDVGVTTADAMAAGGATVGIMKSPEIVSGALQTPGALADIGKKGIELATETEDQKLVRENMEYSAPIKAEAETAIMNGHTDELVSRVESIHGKLSKDLDESAPKEFTYGRVIRDALNTATTNGDTNAIKNIYKTIAELDAREDVDFKASKVIDERTYEATKQFKDLINSNETAESKMAAMNLGKQVAAEADATVKTTGAKIDENILEKVKAMKASIDQDIQDMKDVMGSDQFNENSKGPKELSDLMDSYLKGKSLDNVNAEMSRLGYIEQDSSGGLRADPNRPGIQTYAKELERAMLNPKLNKNMLDDKVAKAGGTTLAGLQRFAESRLNKLGNGSYQTGKLLNGLLNENTQLLEVIKGLQKTANGLKSVKVETKAKYAEALQKSHDATKSANEQMVRRQEILSKLGKSSNGQYAFNVDKNGNETIQLVNGKDKVEVAKVNSDGTVEWLEGKSANQEVKPTAKATPDEVANKEDYYAEAKFNETDEKVAEEPITKESVVNEPTMESKPDEVIHKEDYKAQAKFAEPITITESPKTEPVDPKDPLKAVREKIAKLDETLAAELDKVKDMDVKQHIKDYYSKKLDELQADKSKLSTLFNRIEKAVDARLERSEGMTTKNPLAGLIAYADKLIKSMLNKLDELRNKLRLNKNQFDTTKAELKDLLGMINNIEQYYLDSKGIAPETVKTSIGKVTKYADTVYGKPMLETKDKRVEVVQKITSKGLQTPETALNQAMAELVDEAIEGFKAQGDSLSAKIMIRNLENFHISSAIHRMISQGQDSIFGKLGADLFSNPKKLIEALPKSFKEFFITDEEDGKALIENFNTMDKFINGVTIDDIAMSGDKITGNIDKQGLILKHTEKYVDINRPINAGDKLQSADGKTLTVKADKSNMPTNLEGYKVKEQLETSFPVDILELIGTIKDGKLEIDEQTKTVLKFYSAKMIIDTQAMVGNILSMDAGEMSKYLGITDPEEQETVKLNAANGLVSSAGVRKDIGSEVYQALGIKLDRNTPEFTEESFKSALGVLVQAIAVDNGTMSTESDNLGGKNQNLISVNTAMIEAEELLGEGGNNALIKAMNKLQYLNENRNRPLPSLNKLVPVEEGKRFVMNTRMPIDNETNAKMNKTEEIAYTISDRLDKYLAMPEEDVLKMMGYKDVENSGLHISEQSAQQARNDKLVREWNILKTFAKATNGKKFYIPWGQTVSGRYTMLSDLQYQESKLHREFVVADNKEETVDVNDADSVQMMQASILQGLDMDPDKLSPETASKKFNETFKVTDKGLEVIKDGPIKEAYEAVRDGKFNIEAMAEVFDDSEGHHGLSSIELLAAWDKAIKGDGKLKTASSVEIDAITSGMILTLLQIGTDSAIRMAEKGGIYTADRMPALKDYVSKWLGANTTFTPGALIEAGKKHAAEIEDKMKTATGKELIDLRTELENDAVFKDLYSTIGVAMIGEVQAYKDMLVKNDARTESEDKQLAMLNQIGELNLKNIRSIAKSPVMVYIYGASISSIKKKLTYSLGVDTVVKAIKKASKLLEDGKDATAELEFVDKFIPVKRYKDMYGMTIDTAEMSEADKLLHLEVDEKSIEDIGKVIDATFGTAIESAFEGRLGFVDKNRDAVKSVEMLTFEAYKIKFSEAVKAKLIEKYGVEGPKKGSMALSKEDLVEVNNKLIDEGYGHTIVWNQGDRVRNQSLQKTADKGGIHSTRVTVGDTTVGGQIKESKPIVNTGAASTIPIHAIDGEMIMETLNRELKGELAGKYTGGNVYDAVVLGLNKSLLTDTADYYNTGMIEAGFSRSIMADQLGKLEKMLSGLVKDGLIDRFTDAIGLRPKGDGAFDYAKEANRLGLSVNKMLERIELAEQLNNERLANSSKAYGSGHLYQMGSGVVDVKSADEARAKKFPTIARIKAMLNKVVERDRAQTAEEFKGKITDGVDYVLDLNDFINGTNTTESKANLAQFKLLGEKLKVSDKLWNTLTSKDTVQVIGDLEAIKEALKDEDHGKSAKWHLDNIMKELNKTDANILTESKDSIKTEVKQEADIIVPTETFQKNVNRKIECKE